MATEEVKTAEQLATEALDRSIAKVRRRCGFNFGAAAFVLATFAYVVAQIAARLIVHGGDVVLLDSVQLLVLVIPAAVSLGIGVMSLLEHQELVAQRNSQKG
ncbi:MAG: hypothetical protein ABIR91_05555 [Candidatus Saccharimonadales bacterium]